MKKVTTPKKGASNIATKALRELSMNRKIENSEAL
jgi:hypothetical protein